MARMKTVAERAEQLLGTSVVATSPVAGLGYRYPMPPAMATRVSAVTVFGNPSARLGQPLTTMSPLYGAKTADLCNTNDPICSLGRNWPSHTSYPESGLVKLAAEWVAKHVTVRASIGGLYPPGPG